MLWAFSIWLESVAVLPQLFMLQRTGEAETITTHYLFALGAYRALYIPNWIWRYFAENGHYDTIPILAGIIQTVLYADFFWIYYTKCVSLLTRDEYEWLLLTRCNTGYCKGRNSTSRCRIPLPRKPIRDLGVRGDSESVAGARPCRGYYFDLHSLWSGRGVHLRRMRKKARTLRLRLKAWFGRLYEFEVY